MTNILNLIIRELLYKFGYLTFLQFDYFTLLKEYKFIQESQFKSIEQNLAIQKQRLFDVVSFAVKFVPYYKNIAKEKNIIIKKDTIFEDIKQFPILTKETIRNNWDLLQSNIKKPRR